MIARGVLKHQKWNEKTLDKIGSTQKTTKVSVEYSFTGQLEGKSTVEYLMYYQRFDKKNPHNSLATYVGLFRFEGKIQGKSGTFVMMDKGVFEGGEAKSELKILTGSGTGDLESISGLGRYSATQDSAVIELHYSLLNGEQREERAA